MRVSDYVINFLVENGISDVFHISGGGAMYLGDSIGKSNLRYVCNHHEQALSMAVEGYSRIRGFGAGIITTGPAVTNALTGIAGAWIDSTPLIMISGQVNTSELIEDSGLRQLGLQEINTIPLVSPITKYAFTVKNPDEIKYHLEKARCYAFTGRPGPVWLDLPLNVQGAIINENNLKGFNPEIENLSNLGINQNLEELVSQSIYKLKSSKRPVIYIGRGIDLANARKELEELIDKVHAPIVSSWNAADLIEENHHLYIGRPGLFGQRYSNFTIQNSDLLLSIGARLSVPQVGYNFNAFARGAHKIIIDINRAELDKKTIKPDLVIQADAKNYLQEMNHQLRGEKLYWNEWLDRCKSWKIEYPLVKPEFINQKDYVNPYIFLDRLSDILTNNDVVVTDMGSSFTCTFQSFKVKKGQRLFTSSGLASMGFGLPGAIGACVGNNRQRTICLAGDGGFQFNIQELQTVRHYSLPIKIFIFNNNGYNSIALMQDKNFSGRRVGSEEKSGVSMPDFVKVARAYGIDAMYIDNHEELEKKIKEAIQSPYPMLCDINMNLNQILEPRVMSQLTPEGKWIPSPLEDMSPLLSKEELSRNMIIRPLR